MIEFKSDEVKLWLVVVTSLPLRRSYYYTSFKYIIFLKYQIIFFVIFNKLIFNLILYLFC